MASMGGLYEYIVKSKNRKLPQKKGTRYWHPYSIHLPEVAHYSIPPSKLWKEVEHLL